MVARRRLPVALLFAAALLVVGVSAIEEDKCESAYNYLAGCLTFVSGPDETPNAVCCGGVSQLSVNDPDCLCTIIRELDDNPNVNYTKAFQLPRQCSVVVDPKKCPSLILAPGMPLPPSLPPGFYTPVSGDGGSSATRVRAKGMVFVSCFVTALLRLP